MLGSAVKGRQYKMPKTNAYPGGQASRHRKNFPILVDRRHKKNSLLPG